jgi:WD40 repeat protein|eukprot:COSAG01_NODE_1896_length_8969_cov_35.725028_7_plen_123_part_00
MALLPSRCATALTGHEGAALCVRFNKDGGYCLSGGADRTVRLWNPHKGFLVKKYCAHAHEVLAVCSSDDNAKLASVGGDKPVRAEGVSPPVQACLTGTHRAQTIGSVPTFLSLFPPHPVLTI